MVEGQQYVAQKRSLDALTQDMGSGAGSSDIVDVRPPRPAKKAAGGRGPEHIRGGSPLQTESQPPVSREGKTSTTGTSPATEHAAQHHFSAADTANESGTPSPAPCGRRDSSDEHRVDDPDHCAIGRSNLAELSQPSSDRLPRKEEPRAATYPDGPLSPQDISKFEEDGFVMLKQAFSPDVAAACRESLWKRLRGDGITRDDPSTWVTKVGLAEIYGMSSSPKKRRGSPWKDALSPRLMSAVEQLVGPDAWEEFGCGWWVVTFPGFARPPWGAEGRWHCDGAHFRHYPHSREIGLLPIFLFSDVQPHGGGTAVIRGSHKTVAELVWNQAGTTGLTGPTLSSAAREAVLPSSSSDNVVETTGSAGDVLLTHPLLLHARSTNLAPVEESGVRFMCHPAVPLKRHLDLHAPPETFSVVERIMWRACPLHRRVGGGGADGNADAATSCAVPWPEECDHSPVELPSNKGRWKKGKSQRRGARTPMPQNQDLTPGAKFPTSQAPDRLACPAAPKDVETSRPGAKGEQPDEGKYHKDPRGSHCCDATVRGGGEEDDRGAPDSSGAAEEVDAAVLKSMGFGAFGVSRG